MSYDSNRLQKEILETLEYNGPGDSDWWSQKDISNELDGQWPYHRVRDALAVLERKGLVERIVEGNRNMYTLADVEITKHYKAPQAEPVEQPVAVEPTQVPIDATTLFIQALVLLRTGSTPPEDLVKEILAAAEVAALMKGGA